MRHVTMTDRLRICKALAKHTNIAYARVRVAVIGKPGGQRAQSSWTPIVDNKTTCHLKKTVFNVPRQFTAQCDNGDWKIVSDSERVRRYPLDRSELLEWAKTAKNVDAIQEAYTDSLNAEKQDKTVIKALKAALERWGVSDD